MDYVEFPGFQPTISFGRVYSFSKEDLSESGRTNSVGLKSVGTLEQGPSSDRFEVQEASASSDSSKAMALDKNMKSARVTDSQTAFPRMEITLNKGDTFFAESGAMVNKSPHIHAESYLGGVGRVLRRSLSGEGLSVTRFQSNKDASQLTLAPYVLGQLIELNLDEPEFRGELVAQRGAYFASDKEIETGSRFKGGIGATLFGEGIWFQRLRGEGKVYLAGGGAVQKHPLKRGEELDVDTGCLVAMSPSVHYRTTVVPGLKNIVFGGEGLTYTTLTGPGIVFTQTRPYYSS